MKILSTLLLAFTFISAPAFDTIQTVTLAVPDMNCAVCPITVKKALLKVKGVKTVQVDFDHRKAAVKFDDAKTSIAALTQATTEAGYPSSVWVDKK